MKGLLIFLFVFIISCDTIPKGNNHYNKLDSNEANISEFKIVFFNSCLNKSLKSNILANASSSDISFTHDFGLGLENYKLIDSLAENIVFNIEKDSAAWVNKIGKNWTPEEFERARKQGMVGKRTLKFCLDFYTSKELDDIARAQYKK